MINRLINAFYGFRLPVQRHEEIDPNDSTIQFLRSAASCIEKAIDCNERERINEMVTIARIKILESNKIDIERAQADRLASLDREKEAVRRCSELELQNSELLSRCETLEAIIEKKVHV